jgi:predicted P-loop ATPase
LGDIVPLPVSPEDRAGAEAQRQQKLFDWAAGVLERLGLLREIKQVRSQYDVRRITIDLNDPEVVIAIQYALHPIKGKRESHFVGLTEANLKRLLQARLTALINERARELGNWESGPDWSKKLERDKKTGKIISNVSNVVLIFRNAPKWKGVLGFNEFTVKVELRKRPPWESKESTEWHNRREWCDDYEIQAQIVLQAIEKVNAGEHVIGRAVQRAARENKFHPVRDILNSVKWNGVSRLETSLITYFKAKDTNYTRGIGAKVWIAAVARIFNPGCKVDDMLILEGPQGTGKSTAVEVMAIKPEWYTPRLSTFGSKDAMMEVTGVLIIEIAELDAISKAKSSAAKQFVSSASDRFRPPYGKHVTREKRQSILIGTINPPINGRYLPDKTGNRRYWPVRCLEGIDPNLKERIDIGKLREDLEQLWAEAVVRYRAGEKWWIEPGSELEALALAEQADRTIRDKWVTSISKWFATTKKDSATVWEVIEGALELSKEQLEKTKQSQIVATRVSMILIKHLGFTHHRPNIKGKREYRYYRNPSSRICRRYPDQPDQP